MNKRFARFLILSLLIFSVIPCWAQSQYFTGDGGKGMSLAILVPEGQGLSKDLAYLPAMVQGVLVSNISKYSGISVLDRVALDKVIAETLDPTYKDNLDIVRLGHVAQTGYIMTGKLIKTSSGYTMQINVTDTTPNAKTTASYSGACTVAQLDDQTAIQKASLELLTQMGVRLTDLAKIELSRANSTQSINAQTALAQGITAQRQGTEVAALSYYFQAATFDPSLLEAVNRSNILSANISSGNIGEDARNKIQWRKDWVDRLTETEQYFNSFFDNYFKTLPSPFTLFYTSNIKQIGGINYQNESVNLSGITTNLRFSQAWSTSVETVLKSTQASLQAVYNGLNATKMKTEWGLDKWQGNFNQKLFGKQAKIFSVVVELVNSKNQVIGRETFQTSGSYDIPTPLPGNKIQVQVTANDQKTINFSNIKAKDITDNLTVRIASINGTPAETAARNGILQIRLMTEAEWDFNSNVEFKNGQITAYNGKGGDIVINTVWGEPVISIGNKAFDGDNNNKKKNNLLTSLVIGDSVTSIDSFAFSSNNLTSVTIGNSVKSINRYAFSFNPFLTSIEVSSGNANYSSEDGVLFNKNKTKLIIYPEGKSDTSYSIPNSVTSIESYAFACYYNSKQQLTSVTIPNSVISIEDHAFEDSKITSVTIGANVKMGKDLFFNKDKNFEKFYKSNKSKAGTYTYDGKK